MSILTCHNTCTFPTIPHISTHQTYLLHSNTHTGVHKKTSACTQKIYTVLRTAIKAVLTKQAGSIVQNNFKETTDKKDGQ